MKALAIDLFCGLGGWSEALLAEGWQVVGFDIERHDYGTGGYPGQLVIQDVRTLDGAQFKDASLIVASPPCQTFSWMAMPWSRAKQVAAEYRSGVRDVAKLKELFYACFRIQIEASHAAGRYIPLIVENVRGAQPWVGRAKWNYGSFYLWGDVPALMPMTFRGVKVPGLNWSGSDKPGYVAKAFNTTAEKHIKNNGGSWFNIANNTTSGVGRNPVNGLKVPGMNFHDYEKTGKPGRSFQSAAVKVASESGRRTDVGNGVRFTSRDCGIENGHAATLAALVEEASDGVKIEKSGRAWYAEGLGRVSSSSSSRKAASAQIAKIPLPLARHIARVYRP